MLLSVVLRRLGLHRVVAMTGELRWSALPVLLLYSGHQLARAGVLSAFVGDTARLPLTDAFKIRLVGEAVEYLTFTGPMLAEPAKARLLGRHGLSMRQGLSATIAEYLANACSASVAAVLGLSYLLVRLHPDPSTRATALVALAAECGFLATVAGAFVFRHRLWDGVLEIADPPWLFVATTELLAQALLGLELWCVLFSLRIPCGILTAALLDGVSKVINVVATIVPGQLGIAEAGYVVTFAAFGLPAAAGVVIALARRLRSVAIASAGLLALTAERRASRVER
jgi:uncharacterized membrane protein YbhN (UPF0104 family)